MPCNSDYMAPTGYELQIVKVAGLFLYVNDQLGRTVHSEVKMLADHRNYCRVTREAGDRIVASLCALMTSLDPETLDQIVYKTRSHAARRLADWWEEHQAADRKREAAEKKTDLDRGYLFPKDSDVTDHKKDEILKWYKNLGEAGQSYVNMLLLIRDNQAKKVVGPAGYEGEDYSHARI